MINKIVHQYWDGKLPDQYKFFSNSFISLNPDFQYILWNKDRVLAEIPDHPLRPYLSASVHPVVSSDIARIIVLDVYGGLYFDSDMRPERNIPNSLLNHETFACYENEYCLGQTIANGAIGSVPNSIFIKKLIDSLLLVDIEKIQKLDSGKCWLITGPRLWTKIFFDSIVDQSIFIYPSWYFIPYHYATQEDERKGYITTHIWKNNYKNLDFITHYGHNKKVFIVNNYDEQYK
jgi:mannosyltransferase OCH1-like enzyme